MAARERLGFLLVMTVLTQAGLGACRSFERGGEAAREGEGSAGATEGVEPGTASGGADGSLHVGGAPHATGSAASDDVDLGGASAGMAQDAGHGGESGAGLSPSGHRYVSMLKAPEGEPYWFSSGSSTTRKYRGPVRGSTFQSAPIWTQSNRVYFSNLPRTSEGNSWAAQLANLYQANQALVAFVHLQNHEHGFEGLNQGDSKIGLAYSTDAGESFQYLGDILDEHDSSVPGHDIEGAPLLVVDVDGEDYFYAYFNDLVDGENTTSVARARVSVVLGAAAAGSVTAWTKYDGVWDGEPGIGGRSRHLNVPFWVSTRSDIAHVPDVYQYVWASPTADHSATGSAAGAELLFSSDGITWSGRTTLHVSPALTDFPLLPVSTLGVSFFGSSAAMDATGNVLPATFVWFFGDGGDQLYDLPVTLSPRTDLVSETFNAMTVGLPPPGWSVFRAAGAVQVSDVPRVARMFVRRGLENEIDVTAIGDRGLRFVDSMTTATVSAVRGFMPTAEAVTAQFEFRIDDAGSYQTVRLKGEGKSKDALRLYVLRGGLYWLDTDDARHWVGTVVPNRWHQLKLVADVSSSTYDVYLDAAASPTASMIPFLTDVADLDAIAFNTGETGTGGFLIDDLDVYLE